MTNSNLFTLCVRCKPNAPHEQDLHKLAARLNLPINPSDACHGNLVMMDDVLTLTGSSKLGTDELMGNGIFVDFVGGRVGHRLKSGTGKNQPIAKAVGIKSGVLPNIADVTAGMGRDAFVLASTGCHVTLIERSPVIHALLEDGLRRATYHNDTHNIVQRMKLVHANSAEHLASHAFDYDVVYMDPMYPHKQKSALVKKEMRAFRALVGDDMDSIQLLETARETNAARVVVKRPKGAATLDAKKAGMEISSKNTRYDVYIKRKLG